MGGHSVVGERDFDKWEFKYTVKTRSTLELSLEHLENSVRWDLASVTWRGVLRGNDLTLHSNVVEHRSEESQRL